MVKQLSIFFLVVISFSQSSNAQTSVLDVGLRFQKTPTLYNENGISVSYSNKNLKANKLYFGFSIGTDPRHGSELEAYYGMELAELFGN